MRKIILIMSFGFLMLVFVSYSQAVPIQLSESDFFSQISGSSFVVEDFESYASGSYGQGPFVFANGTYDGYSSVYITNFCQTAGGQCLTNQLSLGDRTFYDLPTDTSYWGTQMGFDLSTDTFDVTAVGTNGTLNFQLSPNATTSFFGFYDPLGISQVMIRNLGSAGGMGNYSFDDITTASAAPIPEPATMLLLGTGLLGLAGLGRKRLKRN